MRDYIEKEQLLRFVFPIDGDLLNEFDGEEHYGRLFVKAKVFSTNDSVRINGLPANKKGGFFVREIGLDFGKNTIVAEDDNGTKEICVYVAENAIGRYRLSSDDNIICLWDINKNKDKYKSIFDNPYLAVYKEAHDKYDACIHLNLYYEMKGKHHRFSKERDDFNLSMMTDKFKKEWQANSNWLKLNFHAKANDPESPYLNSNYDTVYADCKAVQDEIIRFAGKETLSNETTLHYGKCTAEGQKALRDRGLKSLAGYFELANGRAAVSYIYPKYLVDYISRRDFWYDREYDIIFCKIDRVLNLHIPEETRALLDGVFNYQDTNKGFIELMMHEQYFYDDYAAHTPDFRERVLDACRFVYEKGYKGAFLDDIRQSAGFDA